MKGPLFDYASHEEGSNIHMMKMRSDFAAVVAVAFEGIRSCVEKRTGVKPHVPTIKMASAGVKSQFSFQSKEII